MKDFLFIHIPRTAGTSMVRALNIKNDSHETAEQKKNKLGSIWNKKFKFAFVRNPWSRVVSWYNFCKQLNLPPKQKQYYKLPFEQWVLNGLCTHWEISAPKFNGSHPLNLYEYVMLNGKLIVDYVGRYENLKEDFNKICRKLGISKRCLPHTYKTSNKNFDYRNFYNSKTKNIVGRRFCKDIELFNYSF